MIIKKRYWLYLLIALVVIFLYLYRSHIPTTRTDFENLYYFITEKKLVSNQQEILEVPEQNNTEEVNNNSTQDNINTNSQNDNATPPTQETKIPNSINNYVPFTSQAPLGVWDKLHDEACEEASLAMAHYYLEKRNVVLSKEAEKDIQYLASKTKGGGIPDLMIEEVNAAAADLYGYKNWRIVEKPELEEIKKELAEGNIIIIPLAGREIGNPYYRSPGPLYHMLVISGYDNKKGVFITQDPGTKRGKDFTYKFDTLIKANHDAVGDKNKITQGPARILVVVK